MLVMKMFVQIVAALERAALPAQNMLPRVTNLRGAASCSDMSG
jgi:hypothetical protein